MKRIINLISGISIGLINILIGACGGIIAVEALKYNLKDQTKAHASAIAIILPLSVISAILYIYRGNVAMHNSYNYIVPGLIGSIIGSKMLPHIPKKTLSKIFSCFIIYSGIRMFVR